MERNTHRTPSWWTQEAEPDEDAVYGDAAPVVVEWRRTKANARVLELEIAIIEQHELTLPPAKPGTSLTAGTSGGARSCCGRRRRSDAGRCFGVGFAASLPFGLWRN